MPMLLAIAGPQQPAGYAARYYYDLSNNGHQIWHAFVPGVRRFDHPCGGRTTSDCGMIARWPSNRRDDMAGKTESPWASLESPSGIIRPPLRSAWFVTLFGLLMLLVALWEATFNRYDMAAAAGFLGVVFIVAAAPQIAWRHEVRWSQKGIEGPANLLGLTLGAARTEIAWADIVRAGRSMTGYWYVESSDGRRVYWSYLCAGCDALLRVLRGHCPTLQFNFHIRT
jgi:hypothetical protein